MIQALAALARVIGIYHEKNPPPLEPQEEGHNFWDGFDLEDGTINTHHTVFQLGLFLYEAQVLHRDAEMEARGETNARCYKPVTPQRTMEVCRRYCQLINAVGQLRAEYGRLADERRTLADRLGLAFGEVKRLLTGRK